MSAGTVFRMAVLPCMRGGVSLRQPHLHVIPDSSTLESARRLHVLELKVHVASGMLGQRFAPDERRLDPGLLCVHDVRVCIEVLMCREMLKDVTKKSSSVIAES